MLSTDISPETFGYFGIASVTPEVWIGNPEKNVEAILSALSDPALREVRFIVFPELSITGYTCGDLFFQSNLIEGASKALGRLCEKTEGDSRLIAVGLPALRNNSLFNCAAVISGGELLGLVPKTHIPNYQEFYEKRWFEPGYGHRNETIAIAGKEVPFGTDLIFETAGVKAGIEICEDLWVPVPPSSALCRAGAEVILNLSATDDNVGKYPYIEGLVASQSGRCRCAYAYASAGKGESSTDLVFSGIDLVAYDGTITAKSERFARETPKYAIASVDIEKLRQDRRKYSTFHDEAAGGETPTTRIITTGSKTSRETLKPEVAVDPYPFIPASGKERESSCREIVEIQSWGLSRRLEATGCKNLVVGISGGLDSTLALLIAHHTFSRLGLDTKGIKGITMPSLATSERTRGNAWQLMRRLGVTAQEIPIGEAVAQHFEAIGHDPEVFDAVYENSQARERTQILMDLANKHGGMVLGTGDMSELALGWCTYNGDQMSMYNVNAGVPKTLVKYLVEWFAMQTGDQDLRDTLLDIIDTPISPELIPGDEDGEIAQKTEDLVGPYELHDFFLYHFLRNGFSPAKIMYLASLAFGAKYERSEIKKWLVNFFRRFFSQQFKRSCMPDGPKIGSVCLSPRGDWRMPSDASSRLWLEEAENLN